MRKRPPAERFPWIWATVCFLLVVAVAALALAAHGNSRAGDAARKAQGVGACINNILGERATPTQRDAEAHIRFAKAIDGLFLPPTATPAEQQAEAARFKAEVQVYVDTLVADQVERDRHPLGRC